MNRRTILAAIGGLGLTGASVWAVRDGLPFDLDGGLPIAVETIDAPGSTAGRIRVPVPGTVTVVDLFATWCLPCKRQMESLATVYPDYQDRVAFVSVTNERLGETLTKADLRDWWRAHDGAWTVGLDPDGDLLSALGANGFPFTVIADASGRIQWEHAGIVDTDTLRDRLERVIDET